MDMVPGLRDRNRPPKGKRWEDCLENTAIILGPNASGKSNLLDAMHFALSAIYSSATSWRDEQIFPHFPFKLRKSPSDFYSLYEFDFLSQKGERFLYGFKITENGVKEEWLRKVATVRWSTCFHRIVDEEGDDVKWNDSFISKTQQNKLGEYRSTELIISVARRSENNIISDIASELLNVTIIRSTSGNVSNRVDSIVRSLADGTLATKDLVTILRAADFAIKDVTLDESRVPKEVLEVFQKFIEAVEPNSKNPSSASIDKNSGISDVVYNLIFDHVGENGETYKIRFIDESDGTQAWISIAPRIIDSLRKGGLVIADELDASLHQTLIEMIIQLFTNEINNPYGAQLILSTHNTNLLEQRLPLGLKKESFWFIDKNNEGASELYDLTSFRTRNTDNLELRYLNYDFQALPKIQPSALRKPILSGSDFSEKEIG